MLSEDTDCLPVRAQAQFVNGASAVTKCAISINTPTVCVLVGVPPQRDVLLHPSKSDHHCPRSTHLSPNALSSAQRLAGEERRGKGAGNQQTVFGELVFSMPQE